MRSYPFWRVDVFASRPLEGNALAVFPKPAGLRDGEMLSIAREMKIGETTFRERAKVEGASAAKTPAPSLRNQRNGSTASAPRAANGSRQ